MMSFGEYAKFLRDSEARAPGAIERVVTTVALACVEEAKDLIGHLQPGWEPLAPSTIAQKDRLGFRPPDYEPLLRDGTMRDSIVGGNMGMIAANVYCGIVASPSKIALWQEMGTAKIPPRPFISKAVHEVAPAMLEVELQPLAASLLIPVL